MARMLVVGLVVAVAGCAGSSSGGGGAEDGGALDAGAADAGEPHCVPPIWASTLYHPANSKTVCALPCGYQITLGDGGVREPVRYRFTDAGLFAGVESGSEYDVTTWTYGESTLTIHQRWAWTFENNDPMRPVWAERVQAGPLRPDFQPIRLTTTSASSMIAGEQGSTVDYTYSAAGVASRIIAADQVGTPTWTMDFEYDTDGVILRETLDSDGDGDVDVTTTYSRDETGRVSSSASVSPGQPMSRRTWEYVGSSTAVQSVTFPQTGTVVRLRYGAECSL